MEGYAWDIGLHPSLALKHGMDVPRLQCECTKTCTSAASHPAGTHTGCTATSTPPVQLQHCQVACPWVPRTFDTVLPDWSRANICHLQQILAQKCAHKAQQLQALRNLWFKHCTVTTPLPRLGEGIHYPSAETLPCTGRILGCVQE